MQLVYLDEAGISRRSDEPYVVVAGVIVDADQKWKAIEDRFIDLTEKYTPEYQSVYGQPFIFHAMDIWHGSGHFSRDKYSREMRMRLLQDLAQIPVDFNLPVVAGYVHKETHEAHVRARTVDMKPADIQKWAHAHAFFNAIRRVEHWMEENASDEVAMLIAEDTDRVKELISTIHAVYTDRSYDLVDGAFQSDYIVDAVHFTKKNQSIVLQTADHMAFFIKRKLNKCQYIAPFWKKVQPQISYKGVEDYRIALRIPPSDFVVVERGVSRTDPTKSPARRLPKRTPRRPRGGVA